MNQAPPSIWILSDAHKVGSHTQCLAVAKMFQSIIPCPPLFHKISSRFPWSILPPPFWFFPLKGLKTLISPPWPSILIASGRQSVAPALKIRQHSGCFTIYILNPGVRPDLFDLVIAPTHDHLKGKTVLPLQGGLHCLTQDVLQAEAAKWLPVFSQFPGPLGGVLLGGDNAHYRYTRGDIDNLLHGLSLIQKTRGGSFIITPSRRTRPDLIKYLASNLRPPFYLWDEQGDNPYRGILGSCDYFITTNDSISMMSEVCFTQKPVYLFQVDIKKNKFHDFAQSLIQGEYVTPFPPHTHESPQRRLDEYTRLKPLVLNAYSDFVKN